MRRKKKNKKLDIYTVLMLPLMTMFLLNIGLIATTWAWYTASVSTGVNTIKAGPQVSVRVTQNGTPVLLQANGYYLLSENVECKIELSGGIAINGYYALLEISDSTTSTSLINTLFTPVYAESSQLNYAVKYPAENQQSTSITIASSSSTKQLRINCVWANDIQINSNSLTYGATTYSLVNSNNTISLEETKKTSYTINLLNEEGTPLKQSEVMVGISTFSENTGEDQDAVITVEDAEETEITIPNIEGYELVSVNGEDPKESYLLVEGQENVFNVKYKKIAEPTAQNSEVTSGNNEEVTSENKEVTDENSKNQESNNEIVGESANEKVTEQTNPAVESTEPTVDPVQIQETPVEQKTTNTVQEQPATVPQEQQQDESSESETVDDIPVAQSEDITMDDSTEVVDDVTDEIGQ